ncbi:MAG: peptide chain release factor N(5)-glutamine methyltransferase [Chitinophagaceae bacterium]|nr:peptide chain release factor N(5)-glutamine methyltransferase [Chitinophagaceae bacterium]
MKPKSIMFVCMTRHEANQHLIRQLKKIYDPGEAMHIADLIMEKITGKSRVDRLAGLNEKISGSDQELLEKYTSELLTSKPVQYVLNETWFAGMKLYVDENVLIPRPETEELVEWVIEEVKSETKNLSLLDVGTGSGCIAIALKKKLPHLNVYAIDISEKALAVAKKNALQNNADITFIQMNILDDNKWKELREFDVIVSNPPYVPEEDKNTMHDNVARFEPHLALFVPDNDPLIFYKTLAGLAKNKGEKIFVEISDRFPDETRDIFLKQGFSETIIRKDINNNPRMIYSRLTIDD